MKKTAFQRNVKPRRTTHGFLARMSSPGGRKTLKRRRAKGRYTLVPV
jgi:large subunit ribosomal protein L34